MVALLFLGQQHGDGTAVLVLHRMQLRVRAASVRPIQRRCPFLARLGAGRWALRWMLPIISWSGATGWVARVATIRSNTPTRLHRTKRLRSVLCGPYPDGGPFHCRT